MGRFSSSRQRLVLASVCGKVFQQQAEAILFSDEILGMHVNEEATSYSTNLGWQCQCKFS